MNDTSHIPLLNTLQKKLDAIDGMRALVSGPATSVEFKGAQIGTWAPEGHVLSGQFACEGALLCADTADEACRLTVGRLS